MVIAIGQGAAASPTDDGLALFKNHHYAEARRTLEAVVAADPSNATACLDLARTIEAQTEGARGVDAGLPWAEKAAQLAPHDPAILVGYAEYCFDVAQAHSSLSAAVKGRDALVAAIELKPDDTAIRERLYQFYQRAPWPVGSPAKAAVQLEEIRRRNPEQAELIEIGTQIRAKNFAGAMKAADALLQHSPDSALGLYMYGRAAAALSQNQEVALARLRRSLTLPVDWEGAPQPFNVWLKIGNLDEQLGRDSEARAAYQTVLKLDPHNKAAAEALAQDKFK